MKKINAIYSCCAQKPWLEVAKRLQAECNIEPVYFIGREHDLPTKLLKETFPECYYQQVVDAWLGKGFPEIESVSLDQPILEWLAPYELIALKMMDRYDLDGHHFSFVNRQRFFRYLIKTWLTITREQSIGLIFSPAVPHRVFDYALYVIAKYKQISFITFQLTPFQDSYFILEDINTVPNAIRNYNKLLFSEKKLRNDIKETIESKQSDYKYAEPTYMVHQRKQRTISHKFKKILKLTLALSLEKKFNIFSVSNSYRIEKNALPMLSKQRLISTNLNLFIRRIALQKLKTHYNKLCSMKIKKPYVLVALHHQPEETTSPTGGFFADQSIIVELLNSFLPQDYTIVIKEHKNQFLFESEGFSGRDNHYYSQLKKISDRIQFIPVDFDPFNLIDNATAVVTVSGTIGWESCIRKTPAIIFGRAWYEGLPGSHRIYSYKDLLDAWPKILKEKNNISLNAIYNYHKNLEAHLIEGSIYNGHNLNVYRSTQDSVNNLVTAIVKKLNSTAESRAK